MSFKIGLILLTISSLALAQIHTNGGGGPDGEGDLSDKICTFIDSLATAEEKKFVESYQLKYSSYDDFTKLLQKIDVNKTIQILNSPKSLGKSSVECNEDNIVMLKGIQKVYHYGSSDRIKCREFRDRSKNMELLKKIIDSYDKQ